MAGTLAGLWLEAAAEPRGTPAYLEHDGGAWKPVTWAEAARRVDELAHGLLGLGLQHGDRVAILGQSTVAWALVDFAALSIGAAVVPIYPTSSPSEVTYILENAEVAGAVVDDERLADVRLLQQKLPGLRHVLGFGDLEHVASLGRDHAAEHPDATALAAAAVEPDDLLTIVYTSGTTGPPKGCVLSNACFTAMVDMVVALPNFVRSGDRTVLFLPLAHNFGRLVHFTAARVGYTIAFCPDVDGLADTLVSVRPHFLPGVPRVYEKVHAAVQARLDETRGLRRWLANWSVGVGRRASEVELAGKEMEPFLSLRHRLADRLVLSKVRARLGGELRFAISGGAPIAREILEFFHAFGIVILEGYGLTECTSATINRLDRLRFGTVGLPLPDCEVTIAEDGEILLRGPNVFSGYWKNDRATREAFADDGSFRTGDIGELKDGFLQITDRKKDLIATSGGKKIAPQVIEQLLQRDPLVSHALIVGEGRPYITALITANETGPNVRERVQEVVDTANAELARPEQIKRFDVLPRDFSAEEGEITPTLKLKRRVCEQHFAAEVEALYAR
jgi:long-chain acyl-CoA synthetase